MNRIIATEDAGECRWKRFTVPADGHKPRLEENVRRGICGRSSSLGTPRYGRERQEVAENGSNWQRMAATGREWQQLAENGSPAGRGHGLSQGRVNPASCASSREYEEIDVASCASSREVEATAGASRPHPSPLTEGEEAEASCASYGNRWPPFFERIKRRKRCKRREPKPVVLGSHVG
jgi:hypothetical protein